MGSTNTPASKQSRLFFTSTPALNSRGAFSESNCPIDHQSNLSIQNEESFDYSSQNASDLQQSIFEETISQNIDLKYRRRGFYISQELLEITRSEESIQDETEKTIVPEDEAIEELSTPTVSTEGDYLVKNPYFSRTSPQLELIKKKKQSVNSLSIILDILTEDDEDTIWKIDEKASNPGVAESIQFDCPSSPVSKKEKELKGTRKRSLNSENQHHQRKKRVTFEEIPDETSDKSSGSPTERRRKKYKLLESTNSDTESPNNFKHRHKDARPLKSKENVIKSSDFSTKKSTDRRRKKSRNSGSTSSDDELFEAVGKKSEHKLIRQKSETSSSQVDESSGKISSFYKYIAFKRQKQESMDSTTVEVDDFIDTKFNEKKSRRRW